MSINILSLKLWSININRWANFDHLLFSNFSLPVVVYVYGTYGTNISSPDKHNVTWKLARYSQLLENKKNVFFFAGLDDIHSFYFCFLSLIIFYELTNFLIFQLSTLNFRSSLMKLLFWKTSIFHCVCGLSTDKSYFSSYIFRFIHFGY